MLTLVLGTVLRISTPHHSDACLEAFGKIDCDGLAEEARARAEPTRRADSKVVTSTGRNPERFIRKFLAACTEALGEPNADLALCFRAQVIAVEQDLDWARFRAALPECPTNYEEAKAVRSGSRQADDGIHQFIYEITWSRARRSDYFTHRDHPGAAYQLRGEIHHYQIEGPKGRRYTAPDEKTWGVQCLYGKTGELLKDQPGAGTADRVTSAHFMSHMRTDVYWFHVALRLDALDFNGPHVSEYRRLHPVR